LAMIKCSKKQEVHLKEFSDFFFSVDAFGKFEACIAFGVSERWVTVVFVRPSLLF